MAEEQLVVTSSPKKKIGFFSAILIVMGSAIGVGVFLRSKNVLQNSANNVVWALIVWLIAGFAVITMGIALVEVASGRNDNLSVIGWTKAFSTLSLYKGTKFFMTYLYLPFTYFFMPYYVIVQFQDGIAGFVGYSKVGFGGSTSAPWIYFAIGLALTLWMIFSAGISGRATNIQNWIVTVAKLIPIFVVIILGIIFAVYKGTGKEGFVAGVDDGVTPLWHKITSADLFNKSSSSFLGLTPFLTVFSSLGGIFFAFDGIYVTAGIQSEMKHPEKTPAAIVIGLASMAVLYMLIAVTMTLGGNNGSFYGFGDELNAVKAGWVFGVINILISIGIIGILNGFTAWATRWVEDLVREGEMFVPVRAYRYIKHSQVPWVGAIFVLLISLPFMVIFTAIGAYAYFGGGYSTDYGYQIDNLLTFADLMANWMAVFAFAFIATSIIGMLQNRKKHFIAVVEWKHSKWTGYVSVIFILSVMFFLAIDPFISIGLSAAQYVADKTQNNRNGLVGNIATSVLFIIYAAVSFLGAPVERQIAKSNKIKFDRVLSGNICAHEVPEWCPCKLEELKEKAELNDMVLKTFAEAR